MDSGRDAQPGDMLQVIPRRVPSLADGTGVGTGSVRIQWVPPARRRKLTTVVFVALGGCALILVAAVITHLARGNDESTAFAATTTTATAPAAAPPTPAPVAAPAAAPADAPTTGTLRLQRPAAPNKVWLDGQKITAASATVACGTHQVKIGTHGKAHAIDIPCGGELKLSR